MISQAERTKTAAEQREIDLRNGELAASLARLGHALAAPQRLLRRRGRRASGALVVLAEPQHGSRNKHV
jgi:hypothetical protein